MSYFTGVPSEVRIESIEADEQDPFFLSLRSLNTVLVTDFSLPVRKTVVLL